jgi:putative hydrolase
VKEIGKAAADYGVFIELNGKNVRMCDEDIMTLNDMGAKFIVNSDAHRSERVGDFSVPMETVKRLGVNLDNIVNWDKLPDFLSKPNRNKKNFRM